MRLKSSIFLKNVVYNFVCFWTESRKKIKIINKLKLMDTLKLWSVLSGALFLQYNFYNVGNIAAVFMQTLLFTKLPFTFGNHYLMYTLQKAV